MKMKPYYFCIFLLLGCPIPSQLHAQDITGIWRGHFRGNEGLERLTVYDDRYKIEVQIAQTRDMFKGVTYSYKNAAFYGKAEASGTVNPKTKKVVLRELKILEVRMSGGDVCVMTCFLQYSRLGEDEFLQGTYTSTSTHDSSSGCGNGSIFLHKVATSDFHKESFLDKKEKELHAAETVHAPVKKPETVKKNPATKSVAKSSKPYKVPPGPKPLPIPEKKSISVVPEQMQVHSDSTLNIDNKSMPVLLPYVISSRSNELVREITVNNTDVNLNIYDDGAIDNDTVSVYYDNKLIVSKARISDVAVKATIHVEPSGQLHRLVMVADNLGDIPPNTSLLVVRDGEKKYEVRIVSNEQKNAVITFRYKKIE